MIKEAKAEIRGLSPLSWSKPLPDTRDLSNQETHDAYDKRIWRDKIWTNKDGVIKIPAINIKKLVEESARYLGLTVQGKKNKTWTKFFERGLMVTQDSLLDFHKDDLGFEDIYSSADGKKGGGTKVYKRFPIVPMGWTTTLVFTIMDQTITAPALFQHVQEGGKFVGFGRWAPWRGGSNGRFDIQKFWYDGKLISTEKES